MRRRRSGCAQPRVDDHMNSSGHLGPGLPIKPRPATPKDPKPACPPAHLQQRALKHRPDVVPNRLLEKRRAWLEHSPLACTCRRKQGGARGAAVGGRNPSRHAAARQPTGIRRALLCPHADAAGR